MGRTKRHKKNFKNNNNYNVFGLIKYVIFVAFGKIADREVKTENVLFPIFNRSNYNRTLFLAFNFLHFSDKMESNIIRNGKFCVLSPRLSVNNLADFAKFRDKSENVHR